MTDSEFNEYIEYWDKLIARAKSIARTYKGVYSALEVGKSDLYDAKRTDCMNWEIDETFIKERMHWDEILTNAEAAEVYIMEIIVHGPRCELCIWNDGGPKSCCHPTVEECPHPAVKVEFTWTVDHCGEMSFIGIDWTEGTFKGAVDKQEPWEIDGSQTKTAVVHCLRCGAMLDTEQLDPDLLRAFAEEY